VCDVRSCFSGTNGVLGIATGYGLDGREVGVRVPVEARFFISLHVVQTGPGTHTTSYKMSTGAHNSPPTSVEDKNERIYTSTPPIRLHGAVLNYLY
jgi:hypothetical protein